MSTLRNNRLGQRLLSATVLGAAMLGAVTAGTTLSAGVASAASAPGDSYAQLPLAPQCQPEDGVYHCWQVFTSSGYINSLFMGTTEPITVQAVGAAGGPAADGTAGGAGGASYTTISTDAGAAAYRIELGGAGNGGSGTSGGAGGAGVGGNGGNGTGGGSGGGGGGGATLVTVSPSLVPDAAGGQIVAVAPGGGGGSARGSLGGAGWTDGGGQQYDSDGYLVPGPSGGMSGLDGSVGGVGQVPGSPGQLYQGGAGASASSCVGEACLVSRGYAGGGGGGGGIAGGGGGAVSSEPNLSSADATTLFGGNPVMPAGGGGGGDGSGAQETPGNIAGTGARVQIDWNVDDNATTALSLSASQVGPGGTVQATAAVNLTNHKSFPMVGQVQFYVNNAPYGNPVPVGAGNSATTPITLPGRTSYQITAAFSGTGLQSSTSAAAQLNVGQYTTVTTLQTGMLMSAIPTANLVAGVPPDATGTVTFFNGGAALATVPVSDGTAQYQWPVPAGTHSITASYSGDAMDLPSTSTAETVVGPTGTTYASAVGQPLGAGTTVSTITVANRGDILGTSPVRLYVSVGGVDASDLTVQLVSPNGVVRTLSVPGELTGQLNELYSLNLGGLPAGGTWSLRVTPDQSGQIGMINRWSLTM